MPSMRLKMFSDAPSKSISLAQNTTANAESITRGISFVILVLATFIGSTTAVTPTIINTLKMLLPTTLPIAISVLPLKEDMRLTMSSGAEVPNATIVKPITRSLTPHYLATAAEPSVRQLAPRRIYAIPPMRNRMSRMISIIVVK